MTLDFGCGQGAIVNYFHQQGYDATELIYQKQTLKLQKKDILILQISFRFANPMFLKLQ